MMRGWKTWIAVIGLVALGIVDLANGDIDAAMTKFAAALAALGIGSKIDRNSGK